MVTLGPWSASARLREALTDNNPAVRAAAIRKLGSSADAQVLIEALEDGNPDVRILAADRLGHSGSKAPERAQALVKALTDKHAGVRRQAAWSLSLVGTEAWPPLRAALPDESSQVRATALLALRYAYYHKEPRPWPSREAVAITPAVENLLEDPDLGVRRNAKAVAEKLRW
jgi:HEAT repeat protein